jgi:predicted GNAT family acetyltransferase
VQLLRLHNPQEFAEQVTPFLLRDEAAHNLILGLLSALQLEPSRYAAPYLVAVTEGEVVMLVALRTPPHNLILSQGEKKALEPLLADLHGNLQGDVLPGVLGPKSLAKAFAEAWSERTGQPYQLNMAERIYRLQHVVHVRGVPGSLRGARDEDRELLIGWMRAFNLEAMHAEELEHESAQTARRIVGDYLRRNSLYVWEAAGEVVSMAGFSGPTPHGIRLGPVYTPPQRRGQGYAGACVAALSQKLLGEGHTFCFLFTDLANPISNKVYQRIGYQPVCDVDEYRFLVSTTT